RPHRPRFRRLRAQARHAGAPGHAQLARGDRRHPPLAGRDGRRRAMNAASVVDFLGRANVEAVGWALVHFLWQGTLAAGLRAGTCLPGRAPPPARWGAAASPLWVVLPVRTVPLAVSGRGFPEPADPVAGPRCTECPLASATTDTGRPSPRPAAPVAHRRHTE